MSRTAYVPGLFFVSGIAQATATAALPDAGTSLLQMVAGLLIVLALIAALAWCARRFGIVKTRGQSSVRVVAGTSVGPRERVTVVEVGGQWLVLGVAAGSVNLLTAMPAQPLPDTAAQASARPQKVEPRLAPQFADWLQRAVSARNQAD